jgi:hypothetical protein
VDVLVLVQQEVGRLDVAVDDPARLRRVECATTSSSERPPSSSMTMNGRSCHSPTSKIVTVLGSLESRAAASASRVNRFRTASSWA